MATENMRTMFAQRAMTIADAFADDVGQTRVDGPVAYRVEMGVPDGPSTGGGARSVQHLKLVPIAGGGSRALVIGSCDQIEMTAVLRSWELLAEQYAQRFRGAKLPVDAVEYGRLLERMETFFRENTMRVDRQDIDRAAVVPAVSPPRPAPQPVLVMGAPSVPWIVALICAGAALGSALTLALR